MKIGIVFPNKDRRYKTVHVGIGYLVSYARLEHKDLEIAYHDTRIESKRSFNKFLNQEFDLIAMTLYSPVYYEAIDVFTKIKHKYPSIPVCIGGPYTTTIQEDIFSKTPADFAILGEGEITFSELLNCLKGKQKLEEIKGLLYKDKNGKICRNEPREKIKDISNLPFPAYDIFKMDKYPLHRIAASRGCPFSCAWCNSSSVWDFTHRQRRAQNVVDEVKMLIKEYGKKIFVFTDNTFNASKKWTNEFCDLLLNQEVDILWSISLRADNMTQDLAYKMKKAGCYNVSIGIESANNEMLGKINKSTTIEKVEDGIKMLKNADIEIMSQFVIGSPCETLETVKESIKWAKNSEADYTNFYAVLPYRGTAQWKYVEEYGTFVTKEIHQFHSIEPRIVFETPEFTYQERLEAIELVKKEGFYSNQDKKNWMFDFAKETGRKIQNLLPKSIGNKIYMLMKSVYRIKVVKKNNR